MIDPEQKDIGRKAIYRERSGFRIGVVEEGVITSYNDYFVFVRYGNDTHAKATRRGDLEWAAAENIDHDFREMRTSDGKAE